MVGGKVVCQMMKDMMIFSDIKRYLLNKNET